MYFKFHYGKIHIKILIFKNFLNSTLNSTMVRFICFHILLDVDVHKPLNSTMVRFILTVTQFATYCAKNFKFHYGKIHIIKYD